MKSSTYQIILFSLSLVFSSAVTSYAKSGKLSPSTKKLLKQNGVDFKACRKEATANFRKGAIKRKQLKKEMRVCKERFPGSSLFISCKKKVLAEVKKQGLKGAKRASEVKLKVKKCKKFRLAATFDIKEPNPFFFHKNKFFFAGTGLNLPQKIEAIDVPNFDCVSVKEAAKDPANRAEFIPLGNQLQYFADLKDKKLKELRKLLGVKTKITPEGIAVKQQLKLFGQGKGSQPLAYFPVARCSQVSELGSFFKGLSSYFLIDKPRNEAFPYFAVAFYKPQTKATQVAGIVKDFKKRLGPEYMTTENEKGITFMSKAPIEAFDAEGDPKNLCKSPRGHKFMVTIKPRDDNSVYTDYVLVSNIEALCKFGDRTLKKLTQK